MEANKETPRTVEKETPRTVGKYSTKKKTTRKRIRIPRKKARFNSYNTFVTFLQINRFQ